MWAIPSCYEHPFYNLFPERAQDLNYAIFLLCLGCSDFGSFYYKSLKYKEQPQHQNIISQGKFQFCLCSAYILICKYEQFRHRNMRKRRKVESYTFGSKKKRLIQSYQPTVPLHSLFCCIFLCLDCPGYMVMLWKGKKQHTKVCKD